MGTLKMILHIIKFYAWMELLHVLLYATATLTTLLKPLRSFELLGKDVVKQYQ